MAVSQQELTRFVCLFHHPDRGQAALAALESAGFPRESVSVLGDGGSADTSQELEAMGVPERDLPRLQDGVRRGGVVLSLSALESRSAEIETIFHRFSADKIDEAAPREGERFVSTPTPIRELDVTSTGTVIPIAEEALLVGKRAVDRGGVRVYRHTVEEPVTQDVDLHAERVTLEYREVDRPATDADLRAGSQTVELIETAEVPVVQKVARVVEEVRVGMVETDRTETIEDSVRHTEVEVEPLSTGVERGTLRD